MSNVNMKKLFEDIVKELRENKVSYEKWLEYYRTYFDAVALNVEGIDYHEIGLVLLESKVTFLIDGKEAEHQYKKAELVSFLNALFKTYTSGERISVADIYASCFANQEEKGKK